MLMAVSQKFRWIHLPTTTSSLLVIIHYKTMQGRQTVLGLVFHRGNRWRHRSCHRLSVRAFSERVRCIRLFPKHCGRFRLFIAWFIRLNDGGKGWILLMHDFGMDLFFNGVKDVLRLHVLLVREKFIRGFKGCYRIAVRSVAFDK